MHLASRAPGRRRRASACSARRQTMVASEKPVIAICAVRTGSGKSQTTRRVSEISRRWARSVAVVRHPMPYGDLTKQICQRFAEVADMDREECTIEEREEYEPHIEMGNVVFAGGGLRAHSARGREGSRRRPVGRRQQRSAVLSSPTCTSSSPIRIAPGHETRYYPGERQPAHGRSGRDQQGRHRRGNQRRGARGDHRAQSIRRRRCCGPTLRSPSPIPTGSRARRVLVIEDGPTLTHGEMRYGAGHVSGRTASVRPRSSIRGPTPRARSRPCSRSTRT